MPLVSRVSRPVLDDGLRELTRAPLLSLEEEVRVALEIDGARSRLREELERCPDAAFDGRSLDLSRVEDVERRSRLGALHDAFNRAVGRMALHNTRLALSIAKRYVNRGLPLTDLMQEALLGLLKAASRFEPRRGTRFSTSATWWIRQAIVLALQERGRLIRVPGRALESLKRARRARAALEQALGRDPSLEEVAAESGLPLRKAATLDLLLRPTLALDARSDDRATLGETLAAGPDGEPRLGDDLRRAMEPLDEREREILVRRFGMEGRDPETLDVIGERLGVTRERVRQLEKRAMEKLRFRLAGLGYETQRPSSAPAP